MILTNFPYVNDFDTLIEDDLKTKSNTELFMKINQNLKNKAIVSKYGLEQLTTLKTQKEIDDGEFKDDSKLIKNLLSTNLAS